MEERLQKILARAGYGSRRSCEEFIVAKRVRVNGEIATLGSRADAATDKISVDGSPIPTVAAATTYIALNKPRMVLSDEEVNDSRQTIFDIVKAPGHLFAVGRLDFESEGLILLTDDGDFAHKLTHPRYGHEKEYRVLVAEKPDDEQLAIWRRGVVMEDERRTAPAQVYIESTLGKGVWLRVIMHEGRKRQIREICKLLHLPVVRIVRIRIGTLLLGSLKAGEWRDLTPAEVKSLKDLISSPINSKFRSSFRPKVNRRPRVEIHKPGEKEIVKKKYGPDRFQTEARPRRKPNTGRIK